MNEVIIRSIFPFSEAEPYDSILVSEEMSLFGVLHYPGTHVAPSLVYDVARRGFEAYLETCAKTSGQVVLHDLVDRIARVIRQLGEMLACGTRGPEVEHIDGNGFVASHESNALGVRLEGAFVWINGMDAYLATVGSCAVFLLRGDRLQPLHRLNTLAEHGTNLSRIGEDAHWIVISTMGAEPDRLVGDLSERCVSLQPGDRIVLASPAIAVPLIMTGIQPELPLHSANLSSIAEWFVEQLPAQAPSPTKVQGVVIAVEISGPIPEE